MKKTLLILPVAAVVLTGCVAYQPSPTTGQYGYTYDYQVPVAEHIPAPVFGTVAEPRRTTVVAPVAGVPVVADLPPPPSTPPIYSEIPDMTPRERVIEKQTTIYVPQGQTVVDEAAGAQPIPAGAQVQPGVAPGYGSPATASIYSGVAPTNLTTNITTNTVGGTNNSSTNGLAGGGITNQVNVTNAFGVARGTNINEAAGAQPTNDIPNRLEPAPRLPEQPRLAPGTDEPIPPTPQGAQPPSPTPAPPQNPPPFKPAFTPAAPAAPAPVGQQAPAPVQPQ